jgi:hypothetical protein
MTSPAAPLVVGIDGHGRARDAAALAARLAVRASDLCSRTSARGTVGSLAARTNSSSKTRASA